MKRALLTAAVFASGMLTGVFLFAYALLATEVLFRIGIFIAKH